MKTLILGLMTALFVIGVSAQQTAGTDYSMNVFVDSLVIRNLPDRESEPSGSAFEGDVLVAVGRNADGSWLQVRRPGTQQVIGWVLRQYVGFTFSVGSLPLTDLTTGVTGPEPLYDTGVAIFILTEAALRDRPSDNGERIGVIPIAVTIPAIERSPDTRWLRVNYLGTIGWVAEFLTSSTADLETLPISPDFTFRTVSLEIIPVEVQLAQTQRLRDWIIPLRDLSDSLANFWDVVATGQTVPCNPPAGGFGYYPYTPRDVVELPELRRYIRRLETAIDSLNSSIAIMQPCGVFTAEQFSAAYAGAVNARVIFDASLRALDALEENVILQ
ncbi:MAG: hypothetical protein OHK0046_00760 [Anaerolineae bacterium]